MSEITSGDKRTFSPQVPRVSRASPMCLLPVLLGCPLAENLGPPVLRFPQQMRLQQEVDSNGDNNHSVVLRKAARET